MSITVVLNGFKRQSHLKRQIESVRLQTIPPLKIIIWNNGDPISGFENNSEIIIANNSQNLGVWARFSYALNAETEYVCLLDDDTFPNFKFFESCIKQMNIEPALYGARGLRFLSKNRYHPFTTFGWDAPNEHAEYVDIVGHAWFFKREWLGVFWQDMPPLGSSRLVGEDMHFSHMLQKYKNIPTKVPPHPAGSKELWGSDPELALKLGTSHEAISQSENALKKFDVAFKFCIENGFKLTHELNYVEKKGIVLGFGVTRFKVIKRLFAKYPFLDKLGRRIIKYLAKKNIYI